MPLLVLGDASFTHSSPPCIGFQVLSVWSIRGGGGGAGFSSPAKKEAVKSARIFLGGKEEEGKEENLHGEKEEPIDYTQEYSTSLFKNT